MKDKLIAYYRNHHLWLAGGLLIAVSLVMLWGFIAVATLTSNPHWTYVLLFLMATLVPGLVGIGFILRKEWAWWLFLVAIPLYLVWFVWVTNLPDVIANWDEYVQLYQSGKKY